MPERDARPRIVAIALSAATCAIAIAASMWFVAHAVTLFDRSSRGALFVGALYAGVVDASLVVAAALCAWRPVPGTRSHLFARFALVGWLIATLAERWPSPAGEHVDASGPGWSLFGSSIGRLLLFLSLAGIVVAAMRRFALPRWLPVVAAAFGATLTHASLDELLRGHRAGFSVGPLPIYTLALTELVMLAGFTAAFAMVASAVRRRPFLDEEAPLSTTRPEPSVLDAGTFDHWRTSIGALLACTFAIASRASDELGFVLLADCGSSRSTTFAMGMVAFFALVERARRRHAEASSWALTIGSGVAALSAVASVFASAGARPFVLREIGFVGAALTLSGMALLLPNVPAAAHAVRKVRGSLYLGACSLLLSAGAALYRTDAHRSTVETPASWFTGHTPMLFAAFFFVTLATHFARSVEREASIAST
ncbi:MAG: hypothetical protein KF819_32740 [Labilithrix sp.]|nr:hypothetical protein [Labilithrix sp.]